LLLLVLLINAGCRSGWIFDRFGPSLPQHPADGVLDRAQHVSLGRDGVHSLAAFRYELPGPGILSTKVAAAPDGPRGIAVYKEGEGSAPVALGKNGNQLDAAIGEAGTYYVAVMQPRDEAVPMEVTVTVSFRTLSVRIAPETVVNDPVLKDRGAELRTALAAALAREGFRVGDDPSAMLLTTSIDYTPWTPVSAASLYVVVALQSEGVAVDQVEVQKLNEAFPEPDKVGELAHALAHALATSPRLKEFLSPPKN
jgi:hypothetical protein